MRASRHSYFLCLDITKRGDVSLKSYDARYNKNSALVWAFGGRVAEPQPKGRAVYFGSTMSTAAVQGGLVYITEENGYLHCLDAATGARYWVHDFKTSIWSSPYWVDGRIFVASESDGVSVFEHGRKFRLLATIDMDNGIHSTLVASGGVLYVATAEKLFAISGR